VPKAYLSNLRELARKKEKKKKKKSHCSAGSGQSCGTSVSGLPRRRRRCGSWREERDGVRSTFPIAFFLCLFPSFSKKDDNDEDDDAVAVKRKV